MSNVYLFAKGRGRMFLNYSELERCRQYEIISTLSLIIVIQQLWIIFNKRSFS